MAREPLSGRPWIYGIQSGLFIKIGITRSIAQRLLTMNLYNPHPCKVVMRYQHQDARWIEMEIHRLLSKHSLGREWFAVSVAQAKDALKTARIANQERRDAQIRWEYESAARNAARRERVEQRKRGRIVDSSAP